MSAARGGLTQLQNIQDSAEGIVFNIQRYSIQDGPGIRTTVFLKGCPLQCLWCSNPESQDFRPEIAHRDSLCNQCGRCVDVCRVKAISVDEKSVAINRQLCNNCGDCANVCTPEALKVLGYRISAAEVFAQVIKDADFYRDSGGGVTVSGGEPLAQPAFVAALFRLCRDAGIDTCLETCGFADVRALKKVLPYTSLVLFDIKLSDPAAHRRWTRKSPENIIRNLEVVAASGTPVIIRVPLIPGINDSPGELAGIGRLVASSLKKPSKVEILPYHRFGLGKYQMLDREYRLGELAAPQETEVEKARQLFESSGFECEISW